MIRRRTQLKRSLVPIPRSTKPIARGSKPKARRAKPRRVSVIRDEEFRKFLRDFRCIACKAMGRTMREESVLCGWIEAAHTGKTNGRGSKSGDDTCVPLGKKHHDEMDGRLSTVITTKAQFAEKYGLDLANEAAAFYAMWLIVREP